jgi:tRNA wybutosine-synthesizing protein 1
MASQVDQEHKEELEKQQYRVVGNHSAVKVCGWTKKLIRGEGGCYKLKFYGIMSHQCMQMTTSISCANRCSFCWRGYKAPVSKNWKWSVDEPKEVLNGSLEEHHKLLLGFKGSKKANPVAYNKSNEVKHVALSLTGEPITYPKMNEIVDEFHSKGISTFLVTNAQYPEAIKNLKPITQLYISLDAPNKELLKEVDVPLFGDYWERLNLSLEYMAAKKERTCIRLTMIKGINMISPKNYAELIVKGDADFIEVKAYMHIGASQLRLQKENMPLHEEVVGYTKELVKFLDDYEIVSEHISSRVVMLAKKKFKIDGTWFTWIDYPGFHRLVDSNSEFDSMDYIAKTPQVGISGKGNLDLIKVHNPEKAKKLAKGLLFVNENDSELSFYEDDKPCSGC